MLRPLCPLRELAERLGGVRFSTELNSAIPGHRAIGVAWAFVRRTCRLRRRLPRSGPPGAGVESFLGTGCGPSIPFRPGHLSAADSGSSTLFWRDSTSRLFFGCGSLRTLATMCRICRPRTVPCTASAAGAAAPAAPTTAARSSPAPALTTCHNARNGIWQRDSRGSSARRAHRELDRSSI
jgi:hypothetical protein